MCKSVYDRPVVTTCGHGDCAVCLFEWLNLSSACAVCNKPLESAEAICQVHQLVLDVLPTLPVRCQNTACGVITDLGSLADHVANCSADQEPEDIDSDDDSHVEQARRTIDVQSTVGDLLQMSPTRPINPVMERVFTKLLGHKERIQGQSGVVLARTGGRPQQWVRTARPDSVYEDASSRTKRRRKQAISTFRQAAAGSQASASVQAHDEGMLMMRKTAIRQKLLEEAGIKAGAPPGSGLALKANVGITWRQLRKIRRWFKSFGLKFPDTEGRMRAYCLCYTFRI